MALLLIGVVWLALVMLVLALTGWLRERAARTWSDLLGAQAQAAYETLQRDVAREMRTWAATYDLARARQEGGQPAEAARLLGVACDAVQAFVAEMVLQLRVMARYSRALSALLPLPALAPTSFRLRRLVLLTAVGTLLHHLLVTTGERFRLRTLVLRHGFAIATGALQSTTASAETSLAAIWAPLERPRADVATLAKGTVDTFRVLLASLRREGLLPG